MKALPAESPKDQRRSRINRPSKPPSARPRAPARRSGPGGSPPRRRPPRGARGTGALLPHALQALPVGQEPLHRLRSKTPKCPSARPRRGAGGYPAFHSSCPGMGLTIIMGSPLARASGVVMPPGLETSRSAASISRGTCRVCPKRSTASSPAKRPSGGPSKASGYSRTPPSPARRRAGRGSEATASSKEAEPVPAAHDGRTAGRRGIQPEARLLHAAVPADQESPGRWGCP